MKARGAEWGRGGRGAEIAMVEGLLRPISSPDRTVPSTPPGRRVLAGFRPHPNPCWLPGLESFSQSSAHSCLLRWLGVGRGHFGEKRGGPEHSGILPTCPMGSCQPGPNALICNVVQGTVPQGAPPCWGEGGGCRLSKGPGGLAWLDNGAEAADVHFGGNPRPHSSSSLGPGLREL